jgi:hypothetical protein
VLAHGVAGAELERFVKPNILINRLLLLNEDGSQLTIRRETPDGRVVEVFVIFTDPLAHVGDKGVVNFLIDFVGVHGCF